MTKILCSVKKYLLIIYITYTDKRQNFSHLLNVNLSRKRKIHASIIGIYVAIFKKKVVTLNNVIDTLIDVKQKAQLYPKKRGNVK